MVTEGDPAPDFTLTSDAGEPVSLSDFSGKPVVLYFYPKDDTRASFDSSYPRRFRTSAAACIAS
jgi:peroxiredoxin